MTDISTVAGLRAAMQAGPESRPLTIWCDGVQVRDCVVVHNIAGCEVRLRTGAPTPTEAETLAEANEMNEPMEALVNMAPFVDELLATQPFTAAPAAVITEPEPDAAA